MTNTKKNRKVLNMALAVLIAFGLWLYVINVENPTGTASLRGLPVELQEEETLEERGLMVTDLSDDTLDIKLSGRKKTLMNLDKDNVSLVLDVSGITQEGEWDLTCRVVYPSYVSTANVTTTRWDNMQVTVTAKEKGTKEIPVRGRFIGTEAEGALAGQVKTEPSVLELEGPVEVLDTIEYALVQVGGEAVSGTIVEEAPVVLMDGDDLPVEDLKNVTASATNVQATVPVRQVASVPLRVSFKDGGGAQAEDVTYEIKPSSITVVADQEGASLPLPLPLPLSISLGQIDLSQVYGDTAFSRPIHLPPGVTGWGAPAFATVTISMEGLASRQMAADHITLTNVPQGYTAELVSDQLYVWVRGAPNQIDRLTEDQIAVEVDLSGASLGDELQRLPAQVTLVGEDLEEVGVIGTNYSVALRLTRGT